RVSTANWLVPTLLYGFVGAVAAVLTLAQPAILQQMKESQEKIFDRQVAAGKMTRAQADAALAMNQKIMSPAVLRSFGAVGAVFAGFVSVFGWAFLLWLIARWLLRVEMDFMKPVEVAGLSSVISSLEAIVKMLLVVSFSNPLASPSLALLMKDPDPHNQL